MPIIPIDYTKTVIYKIVCNDLAITEIYVGSTTDFTRRKSNHKSHCKTKDLKIYTTIKANGGWENWSMIQIELYPCLDGNAARKRERFWYEELSATLNSHKPSADEDYTQQYYLKNRERIIKQQAIYDQINKEAINKRHANYYIQNKEHIREQQRQYRAKKSQLNANHSEPEVVCESQTN